MDLFTLGYQVRCTVLKACHYGDPQKRPRFFMFKSKDTVPIPSFPARTHGPDPNHWWPYTTVKEALSHVTSNLPNMEAQITQLRHGQHGAVRLNPYTMPHQPYEQRDLNLFTTRKIDRSMSEKPPVCNLSPLSTSFMAVWQASIGWECGVCWTLNCCRAMCTPDSSPWIRRRVSSSHHVKFTFEFVASSTYTR